MDQKITPVQKIAYAPIDIVAEQQRATIPKEFFPSLIQAFDTAMDGGFRDGELITVSGFTGKGKTTFCQFLTKNLALQGVPHFWFTYEMMAYYLHQKFVEMGMTNFSETLTPYEHVAYSMEFVEKMISETEKEACKVYFIDHLHYLIDLKNKDKNVSYLIGNIVRNLKILATKYQKIIVLVAHTTKDNDGEITLSSIRDSSLIAQESDYVYLVHRIPKERLNTPEEDTMTNQTKIILAKNRRTGREFSKVFDFEHGSFVPAKEVYGKARRL